MITWVLVVVGILVVATFLAAVMWHPEKNIPREKFGHWIESLMRYYEDSSLLQITSKSSPLVLRFLREKTQNDGCQLLFEVALNSFSSTYRAELISELQKRGFEIDHIAGGEAQEGDPLVIVKLEVPNIWSVGAGNRATRLSHMALDVTDMRYNERFDLSFHGRRSRSRTLEAPKRLDPRSLVD